ncbi:hypothetical protein BDV96DRAFT_271218 [Lophiotrema nucula]|uniref:Zn(2)-C6 fungal-type domain-containing protein n=1 Tax=Lophiotrema nucula TaxID=690887 RepID=A0A6A5ZN49_9PLEO|nr:hypothetical protein BDV96DRAFT_271218 [Lophiotrema nucula]
MHILALPPPNSLPLTPFGRRQEPGSSLPKFPPQFSPGRSEQHSYPSPPMSDSHSPARRSAQLVDPEGHPYHPAVSEARRLEALPPPPPPPSLLDPRSAATAQSIHHQRPLYPGEAPPRPPPLHYHQPGRAIEPPYGGVPLAQNYAYGYPSHGVPSYIGNQGPGPQAQPTAMIAPPPLRPSKPARRTKAHVASACVNCKRAHLSCDVQRPCGRCVASGKQDSCKDVVHKKRGRPRLRDDKEFSRGEEGRAGSSQLFGALATTGAEAYPQQSSFSSSHRATDPLRVLRRSTEGAGDIPNIHPSPLAPGVRPPSLGTYGASSSPYSAGPNLAYQSLPVAFLNLDLVVLKSNSSFQDLVSFLGDIRGKNLGELLEVRQTEVLQRIRNELRDERDEREPSYMAPITPVGQDPMQSAAEVDIDRFSQGFTDRQALLNFRLPHSQYQSLQTQIRLAKTSLYFVTLVVHTPPRPPAPPLLTQQLAPPTPVHASQTLSAPSAAPSREFGTYPVRPSSSASSAPTSPYFNFSAVRTSLSQVGSTSYGSPSYSYSPTAGPYAEQGYFSTIQPPSQPPGYPSPYPPVSRSGSITSEPSRLSEHSLREATSTRPIQLPPIRTAPGPPPLPSPRRQGFGEASSMESGRVRRREDDLSSTERPDTPDTGKRRRLNIHEVLE